jgi:hypothetical protein
MSLEAELEWEPVDPSLVESAEAREYRQRETQQAIQKARVASESQQQPDDHRAVGSALPWPKDGEGRK